MKIEAKMFGIDRNGANCYEIRPILQGIDPLFDIGFNYDNESYIIYFNGGFFQSTPHDEFTRETIEEIAETYWRNTYGDIIKEIDENNKKIKLSQERERDDMIHELAKDMRKAILKEF